MLTDPSRVNGPLLRAMRQDLWLFRFVLTQFFRDGRLIQLVQHAFENLEESAKDGIIDELLNQGPGVFSEVAKSQWGSYCVQHSKSIARYVGTLY